jgi:putative membrane protein
VTGHPPRFLDEEPLPPDPATTVPPPERLAEPVLLEPEPDAPLGLRSPWQPPDLPGSTTRGGVHWTVFGIAVVLLGLAVFSMISFVLSLTQRSVVLGAACALTLGFGIGLMGYGLAGEWRGYRKLRRVDRLRAAFTGRAVPLEVLRAAALSWLDELTGTLPDAEGVSRAVRAALTTVEIQALLRDRAAAPLCEAAKGIGWRAGLQAASLVAVSPHAGWDGVIAGLRGLLVIREVARLFGVRPGLAVTVLLLRKVAWTAVGIAGVDLLSQSLANYALRAMPVTKHIVEAVPGGGMAALRLYRLASLAAKACCPVADRIG